MGSEKKYSHVLDKFQHIVPLSDVDRIHFIDQPRWIGYGKAHRALTIMEGLLSKTKQHRMPNIMIIGDSNNGKTTLINRFFEKFGQEI
ncbi:TniB family NTP-binding protein, partial [Psychrobacter sp.]